MPNLSDSDLAKQAVKKALDANSNTQLKVAVTGLDKVTGEFRMTPMQLMGE